MSNDDKPKYIIRSRQSAEVLQIVINELADDYELIGPVTVAATGATMVKYCATMKLIFKIENEWDGTERRKSNLFSTTQD
jgi:hypothetical protein